MDAAFLKSGAILTGMSAFQLLFRPLSRAVAVIITPLIVAVSPVVFAAGPGAVSAAGEAVYLRSGGVVTHAPSTEGSGEDGGAGAPWTPPPALTSLSRLLSEAINGAELARDEATGAWYRALASGIFEAPATVAMDEPILTHPEPATADGADPLVRLLTTPLRGIAEHLSPHPEAGEGLSWRMRYGRPSELSRDHGWRSGGKGDALFDDDGSLEPSPAVGVQMKLNW